jgi:hypothetical protein
VRRGGGKQKGASFEREVSVSLSKWVSYGEREDIFWRSAMSGGRATVGRKKGKDLQHQAGDLAAVHELGQPFLKKFYPELKFYSDLNYAGILDSTGHLVKFWKSTITEANSYNRSPMLIAKQNRKPVVVFIQGFGAKMLDISQTKCVLVCPRLGLYGFLLDDFVKYATPL